MSKLPSITPQARYRIILVVVALAAGGVAWWMAQQWMRDQQVALQRKWQQMTAGYRAPIDVLVAASDLPEGTVLAASHLTLAKIPENYVQPYVARTAAEVVGKVTLAPIAQGEQMLTNKVRAPEEMPRGDTLSGLMDKGQRAVTIAVDAITGGGGFVRPGDAVDLLWTISVPEGPNHQGGGAITWVLFQDVPVLAVGKRTVGEAQGKVEEGSQYMVTMGLPPQNASFLLFAREQGRIQLSLRPKSETEQVAVAPANLGSLMTQVLGVPPPPPPPPPPVVHQVEVYKGLEKNVVEVTTAQAPSEQ